MVSQRTRDRLIESLPMVRRFREEIVRRMAINLRGVDGEWEPFGRSEVAATALTDLLIDSATRIASSGNFSDLEGVLQEHRSAGIDGRHYSRFGDAIRPTLVDVLGVGVPREVSSAWIDTFWAVVRAARASRETASG